MVDPEIMCREHLLGEHREIHMIVGYINKGHKIGKYKYLIQLSSLWSRHQDLMEEMVNRGYKHNSILLENDIDYNKVSDQDFYLIDSEKSLNVLLSRCSKCRYNYISKQIKNKFNVQNNNVPDYVFEEITYYNNIIEQQIGKQSNINNVKDKPNRFQIDNALQIINDCLLLKIKL